MLHHQKYHAYYGVKQFRRAQLSSSSTRDDEGQLIIQDGGNCLIQTIFWAAKS